MTRFGKFISRFLQDEDGPTAVEYAVMLAVIVILCIGAILQTGTVQRTAWEDTANAFQQAVNN